MFITRLNNLVFNISDEPNNTQSILSDNLIYYNVFGKFFLIIRSSTLKATSSSSIYSQLFPSALKRSRHKSSLKNHFHSFHFPNGSKR